MVDGMQRSFIAGVLRAVRRNKPFSMWVFADWKQISFYPLLAAQMELTPACLVWNKVNPSFNNRYHHVNEYIVFASDWVSPVGTYLGTDLITCKKIHSSDKRHPFDKPPELVEAFASQFPPGRILARPTAVPAGSRSGELPPPPTRPPTTTRAATFAPRPPTSTAMGPTRPPRAGRPAGSPSRRQLTPRPRSHRRRTADARRRRTPP